MNEAEKRLHDFANAQSVKVAYLTWAVNKAWEALQDKTDPSWAAAEALCALETAFKRLGISPPQAGK